MFPPQRGKLHEICSVYQKIIRINMELLFSMALVKHVINERSANLFTDGK